MSSLIARILLTTAATVAALLPTVASRADDTPETAELWSCSGYCFMGGDTPTNPWIPVSSSGASEEEARNNIDCGSFVEVGITCRKVTY